VPLASSGRQLEYTGEMQQGRECAQQAKIGTGRQKQRNQWCSAQKERANERHGNGRTRPSARWLTARGVPPVHAQVCVVWRSAQARCCCRTVRGGGKARQIHAIYVKTLNGSGCAWVQRKAAALQAEAVLRGETEKSARRGLRTVKARFVVQPRGSGIKSAMR